jgi:hypothetical protein
MSSTPLLRCRGHGRLHHGDGPALAVAVVVPGRIPGSTKVAVLVAVEVTEPSPATTQSRRRAPFLAVTEAPSTHADRGSAPRWIAWAAARAPRSAAARARCVAMTALASARPPTSSATAMPTEATTTTVALPLSAGRRSRGTHPALATRAAPAHRRLDPSCGDRLVRRVTAPHRPRDSRPAPRRPRAQRRPCLTGWLASRAIATPPLETREPPPTPLGPNAKPRTSRSAARAVDRRRGQSPRSRPAPGPVLSPEQRRRTGPGW